MKRNITMLLLVIAIFALTSCAKGNGKEEASGKVEEKMIPTATCSNSKDYGGIVIETITTTTFDKAGYANYQKIESIQTFTDKTNFKNYASATKEMIELYDDSKDIEHPYFLNEDNLKITIATIYKSSHFDYSEYNEEEKSEYLASHIIKTAEEAGEKCDISGTTRADLGL